MNDQKARRVRLHGLGERLRARRAPSGAPRFSTILRQVSEQPAARVSLAELVKVFGDRAFGALMLIFALPNLIPLPPGSSSVLGAPLILIAIQLAIGRRYLWLPSFFLAQSTPREHFKRVVERVVPPLRWTERLLAPRLTFLFGVVGDRLIGITCFLLSLILFLPIPFANTLPALAICWFSLALIQRDGAVAILGFLTAFISFAIVVAISGALWLGILAFFHALPDVF